MRGSFPFGRWSIYSIIGMSVCSLVTSGGVQAGSIPVVTFNFATNPTLSTLKGGTSNNSVIGSAMTTVLQSDGYSGASVTVGGAEVQNTYTGDGHVVGPTFVSTGKHPTTTHVAWTLGDSIYNSSGSISAPTSVPSKYGNFLTNATNTSPNSTTITMTFKGLSVSSISFAFEIFPDASETKKNPADFTFQAGTLNGTKLSLADMSSYSVTSAYSPTPLVETLSGHSGTSWTALAVAPGLNTTGYTNSPNSGSGTEQSYQLLGTATISFASPVTTLEFEDWPATIGINNLVLTPGVQPHQQLTPAPPSAVLFGLGALAVVGCLVHSRRRSLVAAYTRRGGVWHNCRS